MRKTLSVAALLLALCVPTFAGDIMNPPIVKSSTDSPTAPRTSVVQTADDRGGEPADGIIYGDTVDGVAAAALAALNSVLALL